MNFHPFQGEIEFKKLCFTQNERILFTAFLVEDLLSIIYLKKWGAFD
jgi:hypothetical protein